MAKYTIRDILLRDDNWYRFMHKYPERMRPSIPYHVTKFLSCRRACKGYHEYHCSDPNCTHKHRIYFSCKGKGCSSCGRKATAVWIEKQNQLLPKTTWQHVTLTMPDVLWDLFWLNRDLLKKLPAIGAGVLLDFAKKKGILIGIFLALHTFGRPMNRNVHLHLSSTLGGLTEDGKWQSIYFPKQVIMRMWRKRVVALFRNAAKAGELILSAPLRALYPDYPSINRWLDTQYQKHWRIDCAKPSKSHKKNVDYLGQYTKRPPISNARIINYHDGDISFRYFDHKDRCYKTFTCTAFQFIRLWIQHLPDKNFRMIRYYGFLSNQKRGKLLPLVYSLLDQKIKKMQLSLPFAELMQKTFNANPLQCPLCSSPMQLAGSHFGMNMLELMMQQDKLALGKQVWRQR